MPRQKNCHGYLYESRDKACLVLSLQVPTNFHHSLCPPGHARLYETVGAAGHRACPLRGHPQWGGAPTLHPSLWAKPGKNPGLPMAVILKKPSIKEREQLLGSRSGRLKLFFNIQRYVRECLDHLGVFPKSGFKPLINKMPHPVQSLFFPALVKFTRSLHFVL